MIYKKLNENNFNKFYGALQKSSVDNRLRVIKNTFGYNLIFLYCSKIKYDDILKIKKLKRITELQKLNYSENQINELLKQNDKDEETISDIITMEIDNDYNSIVKHIKEFQKLCLDKKINLKVRKQYLEKIFNICQYSNFDYFGNNRKENERLLNITRDIDNKLSEEKRIEEKFIENLYESL